jgi:SAM-dependent methyltransferase
VRDMPATDTESFWDGEAEVYDAAHGEADAVPNALWIRMATVLRLLAQVAAQGSVLDCGMGPGRLLLELERRGWTVAGIDLSGEMVTRARVRLPESAERLIQGTLESLPFPSESFDAAVATGVLEYVEDVAQASSEVARVLRSGGVFVVGAPNTRALRTFWRHRVVYVVARTLKSRLRFGRPVPLHRPGFLSLARLKALLAAAGLDVESVEYVVVVPKPLRRALPAASARAAAQLGTSSLGPLLGTQLVLLARKTAAGRGRPASLSISGES